jgi:acyl dehydratase
VNRYTVADVRKAYEAMPEASDWLRVDQEQIDHFSRATLDPDWMHVDSERARREGPYGGTIAFGFWTISMLTYFARRAAGRDYPEGALYGINYGFDRLRLLAPVRVGRRIRNRMKLLDVEDRGAGRFLVRTENTVEVEGEERPAMVAEWLFMLVYPS